MPGTTNPDQGAALEWWRRLRRGAPPSVRALWFGIADLATDDDTSAHLYVAGCPSFDPEDETAEWATDYVWWPDDRYISLRALGVEPKADYRAVLQAVGSVVERLAPWEDIEVDGVAVGLDEGDFDVLWSRR